MSETFTIDEYCENELTRLTTPDVVATTRDVYATGRGTVIKLSIRERNNANRNEVKHWEQADGDELLAPIVDHADDYRWIEMVQCHRIPTQMMEMLDTFEDKMREKPFHIGDLHVDNIGIHPETKELVCIDYACMNF